MVATAVGDDSWCEAARVLVKVSRPAGWTFGPILFAIGLVQARGRPPVASALLQLVALSFPLALVVFGVNDVEDYASDARNPRKTADGLEGTVLAPAHHALVLRAARFATTVVLLCALAARRPRHFAATAGLLALAWAYSAPPLRLKEHPPWDSGANGAMVGLAWAAGYTFGGGRGTGPEVRKGAVLAVCTAGVHALGAAVDAEADAAVGMRTIATVAGARGAVAFGAGCYALALVVERSMSIFGCYIAGGLACMIYALVDVSASHLAFRVIVYWTLGMSMAWFARKAWDAARKRKGR